MSEFFNFETDFVESLRCIPMQVRFKLDTCGIKLKLNHWHQFNQKERQSLVKKPCLTSQQILEYRNYLRELVKNKTGEYPKELAIDSNPPWLNENQIPTQVQEKAKEFDINLTLNQWKNLTELQRFVLIKLSKQGHENRNFVPALQEFDLV